MNNILKDYNKKNINKFFLKFKSCPLCSSKKRVIAKYPYKNRYSEQISDYLKIDENILIKKVQNVKCKMCSLIYKSCWFNKKFYQSALDNLAPTHPRGWDTISGRFSKKNYEILHVRYESINLYVACTTLLTFGIKNIRNPCLNNSTKTQ